MSSSEINTVDDSDITELKKEFTTPQEVIDKLKEIDNSDDTYKVVGNVMISVDKAKLKEELTSKKEMADMKISNLEKEEGKLREEASELQKEVMESMKNEQ